MTFQPLDQCPTCQQKASEVSEITLQSLLKKEIQLNFKDFNNFYFCQSPDCQTIYFRNNDIITQEQIKVSVGIKSYSTPSTVCYCFQWTKEKMEEEIIKTGSTKAIEDITNHMREESCSCETKNPSGKCCLKNVKAMIQIINKEQGIS